MAFTEEDMNTLGDKLDGLDLTDGERAALIAVFAATDDEVAGYAYDLNPNDLSFKALTRKAMRSSSLVVDGDFGPATRRFHEHQNP